MKFKTNNGCRIIDSDMTADIHSTKQGNYALTYNHGGKTYGLKFNEPGTVISALSTLMTKIVDEYRQYNTTIERDVLERMFKHGIDLTNEVTAWFVIKWVFSTIKLSHHRIIQ